MRENVRVVGWQKYLFRALTMGLCMLLFFVKQTGGAVHTLLGMTLMVISLKHSWYHRKKMGYSTGKVRMVNTLLLIALTMLFLSGILIHMESGRILFKVVHVLWGLCFVIGIILHSLQHKSKCGNKWNDK